MKNGIKFVAIALAAFVIGITAANFAVSDVPSSFKVAVVDVQKIVASSAQVKALKEEQSKKGEELAKFVETAKANLEKEKDAKKKKALEAKYEKEFKVKRELMAKNYETKLMNIDKSITSVINTKAAQDGYSLVLAKNVVLSGGTDITEEVANEVK